jgi:hypothetical protein
MLGSAKKLKKKKTPRKEKKKWKMLNVLVI